MVVSTGGWQDWLDGATRRLLSMATIPTVGAPTNTFTSTPTIANPPPPITITPTKTFTPTFTPTKTNTPTATPTNTTYITPTFTPTRSTSLTITGVSPNPVTWSSGQLPITVNGNGFAFDSNTMNYTVNYYIHLLNANTNTTGYSKYYSYCEMPVTIYPSQYPDIGTVYLYTSAGVTTPTTSFAIVGP